MKRYAALLGEKRRETYFETEEANIKRELHRKLFNPNTQLYADYYGQQPKPRRLLKESKTDALVAELGDAEWVYP